MYLTPLVSPLFGMHAGVFAAMASSAAWLIVFGPRRIKVDAKGGWQTEYLIPADVLVGTSAIAGSLFPLWMVTRGWLLTSALIIMIFAAACAGLNLLRGPRRSTKGPLTISVGFYVFITVPILASFSRIAYEMWRRKVDPGMVSDSAESSLANMHFLFIILCIALSVIVAWRNVKGMTTLSAVASAAFLVCVSAAFFWTVPRAGEAIFLWTFIVPVFLLAALAFLVTFLVTLVRSTSQLRTANEPVQESTGEN